MQLPNGDFRHIYWPDRDLREENIRLPYYSGEAALALARLAALPETPPELAARYAEAADRALTFLTGPYYDFFVGQFVFAEDHWTCLAADALWDRLSDDHRRRYTDFCDHFVGFLRDMQFSDEEAITRDQPDIAGAYGFSPILPPHDTPVGSRSECAISVWRNGTSGSSARASRRHAPPGARLHAVLARPPAARRQRLAGGVDRRRPRRNTAVGCQSLGPHRRNSARLLGLPSSEQESFLW